MNTGGWIVMALAVSGVTGLLAWCVYKVFTTPGAEERIHSPADVAPPDVEEDEELD